MRDLSRQLAAFDDRRAPDWLRLQRMIFQEMERWLDHATFNTHLQQTAIANMIVEAIESRQRRGDWQMLAYVVMPTHLHLFCEIGDRGLKAVIEDFKRWTGHQAVDLLGSGKPSRFWQREWFDHWSRSDAEDERIVEYIQQNPVRAKLVTEFTDWKYGSWRQNIEP
jgi:putative transposase